MNIIKKNYIFGKNFNYYIDINNRIMLIKFNYKNCFIKLPPSFFFIYKNNILNILFIYKMFYKYFIKYIFKFYSKFFPFYHFKLKLKGLGFRIRILSKFLIRIYFNRTNYYYMHIPSVVLLKYRTRQLFFLSMNYITLKLSIINMLLLKKHSVYRYNGIIFPKIMLLMKPGKNKFR